MFALCYGAEDAHTLVLQPEASSAVVRARVAGTELPRAALLASAQRPLPLEVRLGEWDADSGCFLGCAVLCDCATAQPAGPDDDGCSHTPSVL